ncbi:hypothetical protein [Hymenobacter persicinus]|uniref:Uncharacterized protein n=1 Tax=Hymenobacter persicinus TaxID=2025506 RepID=A0A4Q5LFZ2_9BACT|nr:hypothetical protein [Hymenobacter persicinus]RYU84259.1 hypothetical protein EWM57_00780 [Hymenobacter persicinus]
MPASASFVAWLHTLPTTFYDQLAHALSLHGMACAELLAHPQQELPQQVMGLTGLDAAQVAQLNTIGSHDQLVAALAENPRRLYDLLLVGGLVLDTSLAAPVLAYVRQQMFIDEAQLVTLKHYCLELSGTFLGALEQQLPAEPSIGLHRLQVEAAFARYVANNPPPAPPVATIRFTDPQLQMMRLALLLVHSLPEAGEQPFMRAVAALEPLQPVALEPMIARLGQLQPAEALPLTMPELVQLYAAMQVCGMVFVSDVLGTLGLEQALPQPTAEDAATSPAAPASSRQAVGEMVSSFTQWVQQTFPDAPEIAAARTRVLALADAL